MDIDPMELAAEKEEDSERKAKSILNAMVAVTIALLATFMGVCKVKDDNIVQAMQQAQADKLDNWGFYQAKNTQGKAAQNQAVMLRLAAMQASGPAKAFAEKAAAEAEKTAKRELGEKDDLQKKAVGAQNTYDALNFHDDQFDLSDTALALAISLLAITSLTGKKFLYWFALIPTLFGVYLGICGLMGLTGPWTHPDALIKLLS